MSKALAVLLLVSGCSVALQKRPASHAGVARSTECSTTSAYWIADAVGVAAGVAAMAASIAMRDNGTEAPNLIGGAGAIGGVLYLASMGNGIRWSRACAANQEQMPLAAR